jgi:hypothetical protein
MRLVLGLVLAVATAAFGALILGEYQLAGTTGVIAGVLFALAVAEVTLTAGGPALSGRLAVAMVVVALSSAAGLAWAGCITTAHDWGLVPKGLWIGAALAVLLGPWWLRSGTRRVTTRETPAEE